MKIGEEVCMYVYNTIRETSL